jgi:Ca-activated chloride channel family protein
MMRFQHISHLFALGLVPLLVVLFVWMLYWRKEKIKKLGDERLVQSQLLGKIPGRATLKFVLYALALAAIIIGWANLQKAGKAENVQRRGIDVIVALDVSKSMLATDIQPDRLTRAKQLVTRLTDKMQNDRVGLIVFAGRAYLQVPLTVDYSAMKMMLQNVSPDMVPTQGTVISEAVEMAINSFSQKERKYKSLIVISDGEDHDENAIAKIKEAAETGVTVHTVGIGSPQGSTIFDPATKGVKMDENGNPVISKLNENALRQMAAVGNGTYSQLRNTDEVAAKIASSIDDMEQKNLGADVYTDYNSYFQYFLLVGFVLLLIEWLLPAAKMKPYTT